MSQDNVHISVIVVTAFDDFPSRECCRQYGVKAYLRKPVDGEALKDMIKYNLAEA
jgi:YesN/AraC family two-component response regulator